MPGGRPRKHRRPAEAAQAHAERERARRARLTTVERAAVAALLQAVEQAAAAGHAVARRVKSGTPNSLLWNLAHWFQEEAGRTGEGLPATAPAPPRGRLPPDDAVALPASGHLPNWQDNARAGPRSRRPAVRARSVERAADRFPAALFGCSCS